MRSRTTRPLAIRLRASLLVAMGLVVPAGHARAASLPLVDDFEAGLPAGTDASGVAVGSNAFEDPNAATTVAIATSTTPPAAAPGAPRFHTAPSGTRVAGAFVFP